MKMYRKYRIICNIDENIPEYLRLFGWSRLFERAISNSLIFRPHLLVLSRIGIHGIDGTRVFFIYLIFFLE